MKSRAVYSFLAACCATCFLVGCEGASFPLAEDDTTLKDNSDSRGKNYKIFADDKFEINRRWKSRNTFQLSEGVISSEGKVVGEDRHSAEDRKSSDESANFEGRECLRYCIRKVKDNEDEMGQRVNLFLSFVDDVIETENRTVDNESTYEIIENDLISYRNCEIYLDVDCQLSDQQKYFPTPEDKHVSEDNYNNHVLDSAVQLVEETEGRGHSEAIFHVEDWMSTMYTFIRGNLSELVFSIPDRGETLMGMKFKISLTRSKDSEWLVMQARNPPAGRWNLKLVGDEDLTYRFGVIAGIVEEEELKNDGVSADDFVGAESTISEISARERRQFAKHEKLVDKTDVLDDVEILDLGLQQTSGKLLGNEDEKGFGGSESTAEKLTADLTIKTVNSSSSGAFPVRDQQEGSPFFASEKDFDDVHFKTLRQVDLDPNMTNLSTNGNLSLRMLELVNEELSELEDFSGFSNVDNAIRRKKIRIDVNPNSKLIITSDLASNQNIHRIFFDVKNNQAVTIRCDIRASSSSLRIFNVLPPEMWLTPGETKGVAVDIELPRGVIQENINTVTLFVRHIEILEKAAYLYIQAPNSKIITDDIKPVIDYTFSGNCNGKLHRDECSKYYWGVDIKITDSESGLKYVSASPNDLTEQTDFVSGTKNPVKFYYSASCCSTTVKVTAIDLLNNENTRTIDVTAWDNLSEAEIAVIVVGVLLVLLIIVLIVLIIIYCVRKKKSHDLPYTQRYGSRPPARTEGTSF